MTAFTREKKEREEKKEIVREGAKGMRERQREYNKLF